MKQAPYSLDPRSRAAVLTTLKEVCLFRGWNLLAAHVRTTHVHLVVEAEAQPEKLMNTFKSYASRLLNEIEQCGSDRVRWARHGSTRWLWNDKQVMQAVRYVIDEQGEPMAVFAGDL